MLNTLQKSLGKLSFSSIPITLTGILWLIGLTLFLTQVGLVQKDILLTVMSMLLLLITACTIAFVLPGGLWFKKRWNEQLHDYLDSPKEFSHIEVDLPYYSGFQTRRSWTPLFDHHWDVTTPESISLSLDSTRQVNKEVLTFHRRGTHKELLRELKIHDTFGFLKFRQKAHQPCDLIVLPKPAPLEQYQNLLSWTGGEEWSDPLGQPKGDRVDMRRYQPGDPPRNILWKIYARTQELMVRNPERARSQTRRSALYLISHPLDRWGAGLARTLLEQNLLGKEWLFGADHNQQASDQLKDALVALATSGNLPSSQGKELSAFLSQIQQAQFQHLILLVPPYSDSDPWLDHVRQALSQHPEIGVSMIHPPQATSIGPHLASWGPQVQHYRYQKEEHAIAPYHLGFELHQ